MGKDSPQTPFNDTGDEPNPRRHSAGPTGVTNTPSTGPYVQTPPHYPASTYQQDAAGRRYTFDQFRSPPIPFSFGHLFPFSFSPK